MDSNYKFFQNRECEFYPCHQNIELENINCLFCYCPIYTFTNCGGNYVILPNGIKDCSNCIVPHSSNAYDQIIAKLKERGATNAN